MALSLGLLAISSWLDSGYAFLAGTILSVILCPSQDITMEAWDIPLQFIGDVNFDNLVKITYFYPLHK